MFWTVVDSPIDPLLLVGDETGLRSLWMQPHSPPDGARPASTPAPQAAITSPSARAATCARTSAPRSSSGLAALREIRTGTTSRRDRHGPGSDAPGRSPRDGRNPLSVIVPCHRVTGRTGRDRLGEGWTPAWLLDHDLAVLGERTGRMCAGLW